MFLEELMKEIQVVSITKKNWNQTNLVTRFQVCLKIAGFKECLVLKKVLTLESLPDLSYYLEIFNFELRFLKL